MAGMPWIKIYTEIIDDVKMSRLSDAQKWRFIQLIILAGECDAGGDLVTGDNVVTHEDITWRFRCDAQTLESDLKKLSDCGLISEEAGLISIPKFEERQGPEQKEKREAWKRRQQIHREKIKALIVTRDAPVSHDTEKSREEEKREDGAPVLDPYQIMQAMIEKHTGFTQTQRDIAATNKFVEKKVTEDDIVSAISFLNSVDKTPRGAADLDGSVMTALGKRVQSHNGNGNGKQKSQRRGIGEYI